MNKAAAMLWLALVGGPTFAPGSARADPFLPNFSQATFVPGAAINNPYFPLLDGLTRVYVSPSERFELTRLGSGPSILGVQTTTRRDRAFEGGLLVEDTFDYFAQDTAGNVWYFGEDVTNYIYDAQGNLIGTNSSSSWRAGVHGALPGFIMPADLTVGFNYYQEFAPFDDALDQALTVAIVPRISIGIGDFSNVLQVLETTELDPNFREFKFYAPGVGLIFAQEGLDANLMNPQQTFELVTVVPVPEPATLTLLGLGLVGLLAAGRRKKISLWGKRD